MILGMNALGLEIGKNIVLSGVKKLILSDYKNIENRDLLGNFYANKKDLGKNRAEVVLKKL